MFLNSAARYSQATRTSILLGCAILAIAYILIAGGCNPNNEPTLREEDEPQFVKAREEIKKGNYKEALGAFEKVAEKRRDAAESHLDMGNIFLYHLNDPIPAIYHFRKFLELKPDTKQSQRVRACIDTAQKRFAATLPGNPFDVSAQTLEIEDAIRATKAENDELKTQLASALKKIELLESNQKVTVSNQAVRNTLQEQTQARNTAQSEREAQAKATKPQDKSPKVSKDTPATYTVQVGDTLSNISRKLYGTENRWRDIYAANRDRLASPQSLKPGQVLKVPR